GLVPKPVNKTAKEGRRQWTSISASQASILLQAFEEERFPGIAMRESLARRIGIPEARIQVSFYSVSRALFPVEEKVSLRWCRIDVASWGGGRVPKEGKRKLTSISASQTSIFLQAFVEERFPGIAMRESLARRTGIPEARIQVSFYHVSWALFPVEGTVEPHILCG
uniref:Homeobox domain-containing protein n=1 Tax=Canis lupus dingo TaxID=286419 RepID=A0A8C0LGM6_CANLU